MSDPPARPDPADVRRMFDRIAPFYDTMNTVMTAGTDRRWRSATVAALRLEPGARVLDVATGTGKLAMAAAREVWPGGEVTGLDVSSAMLARARRAESRSARASPASVRVRWMAGDGMQLPFQDAEFDAVTIGFGLRNLPDVEGGLREMARVLRPGGRLAVLEIAEPRSGMGRLVFVTWFRHAIPWLGRVIGRHAAYSYLPDSLDRYPGPKIVAEHMAAAALEDVSWWWLPSGLATLHRGVRRGSA